MWHWPQIEITTRAESFLFLESMARDGFLVCSSFASPWQVKQSIETAVKANDFEDKRVVLFYTFEGGIGEDNLDVLSDLVESRGGDVVDILGIDRDELESGESVEDRMREMAEGRVETW